MNNTKFVIKLAAILFAIAFVASLLLVLCNALTKDRIAILQLEAENSARSKVLPGATEFEKLDPSENVSEAYIGKDEAGNTIGYCFKTEPSGFGGKITMIVGITADGAVGGVEITTMAETPGLGAKADEEEWISQFSGKTGSVTVVKTGNAKDNEVNAISGATITSKAVAQGVNTAIDEAKAIAEKEGK